MLISYNFDISYFYLHLSYDDLFNDYKILIVGYLVLQLMIFMLSVKKTCWALWLCLTYTWYHYEDFQLVCYFYKTFPFSGDQIAFSCSKHEFSIVMESLKSVSQNDHGFRFYHFHFEKLILLKGLKSK